MFIKRIFLAVVVSLVVISQAFAFNLTMPGSGGGIGMPTKKSTQGTISLNYIILEVLTQKEKEAVSDDFPEIVFSKHLLTSGAQVPAVDWSSLALLSLINEKTIRSAISVNPTKYRGGKISGQEPPESMGVNFSALPLQVKDIIVSWLTYGSLAELTSQVLAGQYASLARKAGVNVSFAQGCVVATSLDEVRRVVALALSNVMSDYRQNVIQDMNNYMSILSSSRCVLPTIKGYMYGNYKFSCGPLSIDAQAKTAMWRGVPLVSPQGAGSTKIDVSIVPYEIFQRLGK
jgi:hypothetical protein